jgi:hypothetical protein
MNICLIAESSWDVECVQEQGFEIGSKLIHNDFFASSAANKSNTRLFSRLKSLIAIFLRVAFWSFKNKKILFSSFNAEALYVAKFFSKNPNVYIFCPNVMSDPMKDNSIASVRLEGVYKTFANKIFVTDSVSFSSLQRYQPILTNKHYKFRVPSVQQMRELLYVVVMPAVMSHDKTKAKSDVFYSFTRYLIDWLKGNGLDFVVLPHPREYQHVYKLDIISSEVKVISQQELAKIKQNKCYLSSFSSLSLNKRYGGDYGFWVKPPSYNLLPQGMSEDNLEDLNEIFKK